MKICKLVLILAFVAGPVSLISKGLETIVIKESDIVNFGEKMEDNNLFLKWCIVIAHDKSSFYFLDKKLKRVFRVNRKTGRLIKTISHPGEGPGEIKSPSDMRVRNKKVYILDKGFRGIKIFDIEGNLIKEFRVRGGLGLSPSFDVSKSGEIFVKEVFPEGIFVDIYSSDGNFIRRLLKIKGKLKNRDDLLLFSYSKIRLDKNSNIFVLFPLRRELWKYNPEGKLLWKSKIKDSILRQLTSNDIRWSAKTVHFSLKIFDFAIDEEQERIIISHVRGGVIYDKDGHRLFMITFSNKLKFLYVIDIFDGSIINYCIALGKVEIIKINGN